MLLSLLTISASVLNPASASAPATLLPDLYVDGAQANCASGTGSMAQPVCSIGAAIALASPGDTIRIAPGTYVENVGIGIDLELVGMGGPEVTVVDGGASGSVVVVSAAATVRIQGLTLTNGSAPVGGGIQCEGDLTLLNTTITGNVATDIGGGGLCAFEGGSTLNISNCELSANQAPMGDGGGILIGNADCTIHRTTIEGNTAMYYGGGVQFSANNFTNYSFEITDSTVRNNEAFLSGGGGVFAGGTSFLLSGSTISGNTAAGSGGGVQAFGTGFEFVNSTLSGNTADYGGGLHSLGGTNPRSLLHTTITDNTAVTGAGGGVFTTGLTTDIEMRSTILADNFMLDTTSYPISRRDAWGDFMSQGHNFVGAGASGITNGVLNDQVASSIGGVDLLLGQLQLNGGPTETHDLLPGSPAVDAADPFVFPSVDQRGAMRSQGSAPDIGAVEQGTIGSDEICNGDGGDGMSCTPCPCANNAPMGSIGGCMNSTGSSARLTRTGTSSLTSANLRYEAEGLPATSAAILLSGSAIAPASPANPCFGTNSGIQSTTFDGLRCVVQGLLRHGVRSSDASGRIGVTTNGWGTPNGFFNFSAFAVGETRFFQVVYRDNPAATCQTGLNTTQASSVSFVP